jgi:hypothetical protein
MSCIYLLFDWYGKPVVAIAVGITLNTWYFRRVVIRCVRDVYWCQSMIVMVMMPSQMAECASSVH